MSAGRQVESLIRQLSTRPLHAAEAEYLRTALHTQPYLRYLFLRCDAPLRAAHWYSKLVLQAHARDWQRALQVSSQNRNLEEWAFGLCAHQYPRGAIACHPLEGPGWDRIFQPWTIDSASLLLFEVRHGDGVVQALLKGDVVHVRRRNSQRQVRGQVALRWRIVPPHRQCRGFEQAVAKFLLPKKYTCPVCQHIFIGVVGEAMKCCNVASVRL